MSVLVVDDHALVREGLRRLLETVDAEIIEAADGREALAMARAPGLRLVILDLNLPGLGGLELLRRMVRTASAPVLVLSMHAEPMWARRALDAGAAGYMTKNAAPAELLAAVRRLLAGGKWVEAELAQALAAGPPETGSLDALTARELEIMRLLAAGASLSQIADAVGVGYKTVANTLSQIKSKLGVPRTAELVRLAIETGMR